jgi:hypothetical protein
MDNLEAGTYVELQGYHVGRAYVALVVDADPNSSVWISDHQEGGWYSNGEYKLEEVDLNPNVNSDHPGYRYMAFDDLEDHLIQKFDTVELAAKRAHEIQKAADIQWMEEMNRQNEAARMEYNDI